MSNLPLAIVFDRRHRLGNGLVGMLEKKGTVRVIVVSEVDEIKRLREEPNFIFDLEGEIKLWQWASDRDCQLTVISTDFEKNSVETDERLRGSTANWRLIKAMGLYGQFLLPRGYWICEMFRNCVLNKPLPVFETKSWMLYEKDFWEAVCRITFLQTPVKRSYKIWGTETERDGILKALWKAGQMTVREAKIEGVATLEEVDEDKREVENLVRFEPKIRFEEIVDIALQPYFENIEELKKDVLEKKAEEKTKQKYEVLFEEKKEQNPLPVFAEKEVGNNYALPEIKINKKAIREEEVDPVWQKLMQKKVEMVTKTATEKIIPKIDIEKVKKNHSTEKKQSSKHFFRIILAVFIGLLIVGLISGLWFAIGVIRVSNNLKNFSQMAAAGEWNNIEKSNKQDLAFLKKVENLTGGGDLIKVVEDTIYLEGQLQVVYATSNEVAQGVWGEKDVSWKTLIPAWQNALLSTDTSLAKLEARLQGNLDWVPGRWLSQVRSLRNQLADWRTKIKLGVEGLPVFNEFVGASGGRKTYLVLLQNEMELRPTGGFMGSYGILTFEDGKFVDFRVQDIYAADGQIQGYVEPPAAIKKYLIGPDAWKMRDSNWQPYFVAASKDIRWFYEKASGQKVDGVIGLTLASVEKILASLGSVNVPDYGVKVNKDNLYEQAQFFAEKNFFPGSTQKQSFLGKLASALFEELRAVKGQEREGVVGGILDSLVDRDIQIALNEQKSAGVLAVLGWDGGLVSGKCGEENCVADYLMLVEANLGVNKANYFINRKVAIKPIISGNILERELKIELENTAKNSNWPAGDYKNYMRTYLPADVEIEDVLVWDPNKANNQLRYGSGDYSLTKYGDKRELGFLVEVPVASKRVIKIVYRSNIKISADQNFSYLLYWQKQSGFGKKTDLEFQFSPPSGKMIGQIYPEAELKGGVAWIGQKFNKDLAIGIELLP